MLFVCVITPCDDKCDDKCDDSCDDNYDDNCEELCGHRLRERLCLVFTVFTEPLT